METQSSAPTAAPQKKRNWVPIIIVVVVVVVIAGGVAFFLLRDDSGTEAGKPAGQTAKAFYAAWQDGDQAAAAKVANAASIDVLFAVPATDAQGFQFGGCSATGDSPFPKECVWSRPGGELTMELEKEGDSPTVTKVTYGPAGLPPDDSTTSTTG